MDAVPARASGLGDLVVSFVVDVVLLALRLFLILSVFTAIGVALAAMYAWWNGADPWAAWTTAFLAVLVGGFIWYWLRG